jgi:hypothetical protein
MRLRSRNAIAILVATAVLIGAGVALAQSQSPSPSPTPRREKAASLSKEAFLDDVARRLGIQRARLDTALKAMALADVKWAEDSGFITEARADRLRERINSGRAKGLGRFGLHGALGFGVKGVGLRGGFLKGRFRGGFGLVEAAADYLGLPEEDLLDALRSRTLAQVTRDRGRGIDGLIAALRAAKKARLDDVVAEGEITVAQESALLKRFDSQIGDAVNGIPAGLTELARRLGVPRPRLIAAIKNAAIARVDEALSRGGVTERAEAIKERIRSSPAWRLGGIGSCFGARRFGRSPWHDRSHLDRPGVIEESLEL